MARIVEYKDIPLDDLTIGKGQARVQDVGKEIENLAESIKKQGLLQPIVVCAAREEGKWEILTGQRRFLAHKMLRRDSITAAVLGERVEEHEAKTISITENLVRRKLSGKELTDGIVYLYNIYGSMKDVVETTGLSADKVRTHVRYPRLIPELKKMVDDGLNIKTAIKAQDAATQGYEDIDTQLAIMLAKQMIPMSDVQRKKFVQESKNHPEKPIDEMIEHAKSAAMITQIMVIVTQDTRTAIQQFAREESLNQEDATAALIEEALISRGLLEE